MGSWSLEQRERLALEEEVVKMEFPSFRIEDRTIAGETKIVGEHIVGSGKIYTICVKIPASFPEVVPNLYVIKPYLLYDYNGKRVVSYGTSHDMHVLETDWDQYVRICHWKSTNWSASNSLTSVIAKGLMWLESYDLHLKTGKKISDYLLNY